MASFYPRISPMYQTSTFEEWDPGSIEQFLQNQYPEIVSAYPPADIQELVRYLGANGRESIVQFEAAIRKSIHIDTQGIIDHLGAKDPAHLKPLLTDSYVAIYWSQDRLKAVMQATLASLNPLSKAVIRAFYRQQAINYMSAWWQPSCPFQGLIAKVAKRVVESIV